MVSSSRARLARLLGPFAALFAVVLFFAVVERDTFLSVYNAQTIAAQTVIVGLGAIGMTFVIVSGGIDLSVGSVIALSSVVTALLLKQGHGWLFAASLGVGARSSR
jgi:ribose transport system permease protein